MWSRPDFLFAFLQWPQPSIGGDRLETTGERSALHAAERYACRADLAERSVGLGLGLNLLGRHGPALVPNQGIPILPVLGQRLVRHRVTPLAVIPL